MKDYKVLLTVEEFPQTQKEREHIASWLQQKAEEIATSNPKQYSKRVKFKLMK